MNPKPYTQNDLEPAHLRFNEGQHVQILGHVLHAVYGGHGAAV